MTSFSPAAALRVSARVLQLACVAALLAACTTPQPKPTSGVYKVGSPYQVNGVWYYPQEDPFYDETGIASWYGAQFAGRPTANGETFDPRGLTAAHRTLPMPVLVRVTNLENGKSIVVRVNDRGPFIPGRVIDMSEKAATLLGFRSNGLARVRVQFLGRADTEPLVAADGAQATPLTSTTVQSAPTTTVASGTLAPPPGTSAAPGTAPRPTAGPTTSALPPRTVSLEPDGQVTTVAVPARTALWVQAGAFLSQGNADRLKARLRGVGQISISPKSVGTQRYYRVRVGPFSSVAEADAALARVLTAGQAGAQIVVE